MRKYYVFILLSLIFAFSNCKREDKSQGKEVKVPTLYFNRGDFKKTINLKAETIDVKIPALPESYDLVNDTLLFIKVEQNHDPFEVYVYNLKNRKVLFKIAKDGVRCNGFEGSCKILHSSSYQKEVFILDALKNKLAIYNVEKLLKSGGQTSPQNVWSFTDDSSASSLDGFVSLNLKQLICYNRYSLDDKKYTNHVPCLLVIDHKKGLLRQPKYKYETYNVSDGRVLVSPAGDKIWVLNSFFGQIDVYNRELQLIRTLKGPGYRTPSYKRESSSPLNPTLSNTIEFKTGGISAYTSVYSTKTAVYAVYDGRKNGSSAGPKPMEVFKFGWNGELLCRYQLDLYATAISVDSQDKYLYATVQKYSCNENPKLVRSRLK